MCACLCVCVCVCVSLCDFDPSCLHGRLHASLPDFCLSLCMFLILTLLVTDLCMCFSLGAGFFFLCFFLLPLSFGKKLSATKKYAYIALLSVCVMVHVLPSAFYNCNCVAKYLSCIFFRCECD